jgi:hypothetical protein
MRKLSLIIIALTLGAATLLAGCSSEKKNEEIAPRAVKPGGGPTGGGPNTAGPQGGLPGSNK